VGIFDWKKVESDRVAGRNMFGYWFGMVLIGLATLAMTFMGILDPSAIGVGPITGNAGRVASESISGNDFRRLYYQVHNSQQGQSEEQTAQIPQQVMQMLVSQKLDSYQAKVAGFASADSEVVSQLRELDFFKNQEGQFDKSAFSGWLQRNLYTEKTFLESQKEGLASAKFKTLLSRVVYIPKTYLNSEYDRRQTTYKFDVVTLDKTAYEASLTSEKVDAFVADPINDKALRTAFALQKKSFDQSAQVKARHILVAYEGGAADSLQKRSKEEAKKFAEGLRVKVAANPASFIEVAKANTDEQAGKTSGGSLGWFTKEKMVPEFSAAAFALEKGAISEVVESKFGFHVILVEDKKEAIVAKFEENKARVAKKVMFDKEGKGWLVAKATEVHAAVAAGSSPSTVSNVGSWKTTSAVKADAGFVPMIGSSPELRSAVFALKAKGDIVPEPLVDGDKQLVVRLAEKSEPKSETAEADKQSLMRQLRSQASRDATEQWTDYFRNKFDKAGRIYQNPKYLRFNQQRG